MSFCPILSSSLGDSERKANCLQADCAWWNLEKEYCGTCLKILESPPKDYGLNVVPVPLNKKWYESKTIWVNGLALVASVAQVVYGKEILPAADQAAILTVVNLILRLITKHNITW